LFRSDLVLLEDGQPVVEKSIIVNDPLRYKGINIFQSSYGELNRPVQVAELPEQIELQFVSTVSGMVYTRSVKAGQSIEIPEGLGRFTIRDYQPAAKFMEMAIGPTIIGVLEAKDGSKQQLMLPIQFPKFDTMRRGSVIISVAKQFSTAEQAYFTGLQITHDPGVPIVYIGFILMIAGCVVTFFMSHQRIVVEVLPDRGSAKVMVAGTANKNKYGFQQKLERLSEKLAGNDVGS
jgi:cytochrome c biogenesis protein